MHLVMLHFMDSFANKRFSSQTVVICLNDKSQVGVMQPANSPMQLLECICLLLKWDQEKLKGRSLQL